MIRINLLPREEKVRQKTPVTFKADELVIPAAILAAVAMVILGTSMAQSSKIGSLGKSIAEVDAQSRAIAPQIERVNRLAQERAELDLRLGVISKLEMGRTQSVRLMDELARCVPDHLWLTSAQQDAGSALSVEGVTFSNLVVSDFMSRLERSPMFAGVELAIAERGAVTDKSVVKFRITCQITTDRPAQ